ncbi:MAG TPA: phenylalanine--tRNA ligase subunit alpha [Acidimicrobiia bacterium]|nr:phenylalanine--tRNA ligase subunit alpha [Acidimicrobiia bacterium]
MDSTAALDDVLAKAPAAIDAAGTLDELGRVESGLLGKSSAIGEVRRSMGGLDPAERPIVGARLNEVTEQIQSLVEKRRAALEVEDEALLLAQDRIDVTLESYVLPDATTHVLQQTIDEIVDIFVGLGYRVADGPEAELAWYNFDALNTPPTHPSRLESDTVYLDYGDPADEVLLRTQTSPVQVRWMETHDPPVYVVVPGKVYRKETTDATHLPVFHQVEGLAVDESIRLSDLKGTLAHFSREFFGPKTEVRFRPHFFPFTEPSAELDVSCFDCDGGEPGCRVCGGAGWLEMLGCGMVDPAVLEAVGYDPDQLSGFAFGMGVERLAMVRYGINDIRHFVDNDLRFLGRFR